MIHCFDTFCPEVIKEPMLSALIYMNLCVHDPKKMKTFVLNILLFFTTLKKREKEQKTRRKDNMVSRLDCNILRQSLQLVEYKKNRC